jgi:hypothetical protein
MGVRPASTVTSSQTPAEVTTPGTPDAVAGSGSPDVDATPPPPPPEPGAGNGSGQAWIRTDTGEGSALAPPRGVVYGDRESGTVARSDPYKSLRGPQQEGASDQSWPLEDPSQPYAMPKRSRVVPFLVGLLVGIVLTAGSLLTFQTLTEEDEPTAAPTDSTTATTSAVPAAPAEAPTEDATEPDDSASAADELSPSTDDETQAAPPPAAIAPVGNALAIADLQLQSDGIGPVTVGLPADQALGRLVASLGAPDADTGLVQATGEFGACAGEQVRIVRWGPLVVVVTSVDGVERLASYRVDLQYGGLDSRAATLATLSGLRAGDTIADLETIYADFTIEYLTQPDVGLVFELRRPTDSELLLWGPITSADADGLVGGIYAVDACAAP